MGDKSEVKLHGMWASTYCKVSEVKAYLMNI